ncbi:MAG: hypothetical protein ACFFCT_00390 [Candidatus Odinarchaeota archaeon]
MSEFKRSVAYPWALTGIFAAFHFVTSMLPYSVLGTGGGFLSWGMISAPIVGFLLGPFFGTISILIGSILNVIVFNPGEILGPVVLTLAPASGALAAGLLRANKPVGVVAIYLIGLVVFLIGPIGLHAYPYLWLHTISLLLVFLFIIPQARRFLLKGLHFKKEGSPAITVFSVWLMAFIALLADNLIGGAIGTYYFAYILLFDIPGLASVYMGIALVYPVERIIASIIVAGVALAVGHVLAKSYFDLPVLPTQQITIEELSEEEVQTE